MGIFARVKAWQLSCKLAVFSMMAVGSCAQADDFFDNWNFDSFGTLSYTKTDKYDDRIPRRNITQSGKEIWDNGWLLDSRIGFQAKWHINDHWELVSQAVGREQLDNMLFDYFDIFYLSYQANNEWRFGVGRQAFDLFFMSDHLNTGYSYDWIRPPTEFYGIMPYESFDGFKISREWGDFDNSWTWRLSVGNIETKFDADVLVSSDDVDSTKAQPIYSTALTWQTGKWHVRGSYAHFNFKQDLGDPKDRQELSQAANEIAPIWPDFMRIADELSKDFILRILAFGLQWQHDDWKVQTEWSSVDSDIVTFDGQRGYFHVSKRFDEWQPFVTLGFARDDSQFKYQKPMGGYQELDEFYYEMLNFHRNMRHNQESISLGVRWDFSRQKALKLQCDKFYFEKWSGSIHGRVDYSYPGDETKSWCSVSLDWVF